LQLLEVDKSYQKTNTCTIANILAPCTATGFLVNGCLFKAIDNSIFQFLEMDNSYQKTNTCTIANILVEVDLRDDLAKEIVMEM
jgi:hypothetical protein